MRVVLVGPDYQDLWFRVCMGLQGGKCAHCGCSRGLSLHHKRGRGMGGGFRLDTEEGVVGLCESCHRKADRHKDSKFGDAK
jgi:hypothetical protein